MRWSNKTTMNNNGIVVKGLYEKRAVLSNPGMVIFGGLLEMLYVISVRFEHSDY